MNCTEVTETLPLYFCGECDAATCLALESHAASCPACVREIKTQQHFDDALRGAFAGETLELQPLRERVRREIRSTSRSGWFFGWRPMRWAPMAAALVALIALGGFYFANQRAETRLYRAAVKDHIDDAVMQIAKQGWRTTPEDIKAFAVEQFGTDEFLPKLAPPDFQLKRVRMCNLRGNRFAHFIYARGGREVSFFVQNRTDALRGPLVETINGQSIYALAAEKYEAAGFQSSKFTVLIVTDFAHPENIRLAREAAGRLS